MFYVLLCLVNWKIFHTRDFFHTMSFHRMSMSCISDRLRFLNWIKSNPNVLGKWLPFTDRLPDFFLFEYQFLLHFPHNWDLVVISREHFQLKNIHSIAYQCNKQYFRNDIRNSICFWDCYAQLNGNWHSWSGLWSLAANRWSNPQLDLQ